MRFKASEDTIRKAMRLAIEASIPMGMGRLHFDPNQLIDDKDLPISQLGAFVDYFGGRMVKFRCGQEEPGTWRVNEPPNIEYQSWMAHYPTYRDLLETAGPIEIIPEGMS